MTKSDRGQRKLLCRQSRAALSLQRTRLSVVVEQGAGMILPAAPIPKSDVPRRITMVQWPPDPKLVELCRTGNQDAARQIFDAYVGRLLAVAGNHICARPPRPKPAWMAASLTVSATSQAGRSSRIRQCAWKGNGRMRSPRSWAAATGRFAGCSNACAVWPGTRASSPRKDMNDQGRQTQ